MASMMLSLSLRPNARSTRHVCRECESRRALFRYHGIVKWDRYHTLCFQCYRRHMDRQRATRLGPSSPGGDTGIAATRLGPGGAPGNAALWRHRQIC